MKKLSYLALLFVAALMTNCDTNDDTFYKTIYVEGGNNIVTFPPQTTYNVGDYLYVKADLARYIPNREKPICWIFTEQPEMLLNLYFLMSLNEK